MQFGYLRLEHRERFPLTKQYWESCRDHENSRITCNEHNMFDIAFEFYTMTWQRSVWHFSRMQSYITCIQQGIVWWQNGILHETSIIYLILVWSCTRWYSNDMFDTPPETKYYVACLLVEPRTPKHMESCFHFYNAVAEQMTRIHFFMVVLNRVAWTDIQRFYII